MKYRYKAIDPETSIVTGEVIAESLEEAKHQLHEQKLRVVHLQSDKKRDFRFTISRTLSENTLSILFSQLALMTEGGIDVVTALYLIEERSKGFERKKIADLLKSVKRGKLLSEAFEEARCFPSFVPGMLKSGEAAGRLPSIFRQLAAYFKDERAMKQKMMNALAYPIILMLTSVVVLNVVLRSVIPVFVEVFSNGEAQLPAATRALIAFSEHMNDYGFIYPIIFGGIFFFSLFLKYYSKTRYFFQKRCYHFFPCRPFYRDPFELRFLRTVKIQLDNGVDILRIFKNAASDRSDPYIATQLRQCVDELITGENLAEVMRHSRLFKEDSCRFIALGEASSSLSDMLDIAIQMEEERQKNRADRIAAYIEPVLILVMAGIVGFIIFSIAIPMFDMVNQF